MAVSLALRKFHRSICLLLLGAAALSGCASSENDAPVTMSMAPAMNHSSDEGGPAVSLPESTDVLPTRSELSQDTDTAATDAGEPLAVAADASGAATSVKQGRLVAATKTVPQASAPDGFTKADENDVKVAALADGEEQSRKSLAQSAISLVSFVKPDEPRNDVDGLIEKYANLYDVPVALVRRVVKRESNFRPWATNRGHYGLMQIKPATARSMGYSGSARGLLDAETNLKYAVKYLRGAFLVADGNHDRADRLYQTGYYYHAKRKGLLDETGLGKDRRRRKS